MSRSPVPIPFQYIMLYAGLGISILSAIFMLQSL
jgi:hypothetical protein